ncbi:hypothetical protein LRAMOSA10216 [Lichtheimia ramosa]|uniref:Uncharacterized protein n=1 Tax=Lichtheimia ramosa TaxID=688394 RepID=A0A077WNB0_9FUNG|nr:hypothetical protein LRAMOSA10216 [Lichtheimia ramosa]
MATISPIHPAYAAQQIGVLPPNMLTPASGIAPYYPGPGMPYSSMPSMMSTQPVMGATPYYPPPPAAPPTVYGYPQTQPGCLDHPEGCCIGL